jgi:hypothetical protein
MAALLPSAFHVLHRLRQADVELFVNFFRCGWYRQHHQAVGVKADVDNAAVLFARLVRPCFKFVVPTPEPSLKKADELGGDSGRSGLPRGGVWPTLARQRIFESTAFMVLATLTVSGPPSQDPHKHFWEKCLLCLPWCYVSAHRRAFFERIAQDQNPPAHPYGTKFTAVDGFVDRGPRYLFFSDPLMRFVHTHGGRAHATSLYNFRHVRLYRCVRHHGSAMFRAVCG